MLTNFDGFARCQALIQRHLGGPPDLLAPRFHEQAVQLGSCVQCSRDRRRKLFGVKFGWKSPAKQQAHEPIVFFCTFVAGSFLFNGALFVANAAFNNLGFAFYSAALNWGR